MDIALTLAMADLKAKFIDPEKGVVHYRTIRGSEEFERYKDLTKGLQLLDLHSLRERNQKLAFWINIYNTVVIHGVIELGLEKSVKELPAFFNRVTYEIGGFRFSLNEMEHGILRGNRRHPYGLLKPFLRKDPRMKFTITPLDPRIHFALVCGARSCPPIAFYEAERIDSQLQLAAESFINSPQVKILFQRSLNGIKGILEEMTGRWLPFSSIFLMAGRKRPFSRRTEIKFEFNTNPTTGI
jgi:hypothetical protein